MKRTLFVLFSTILCFTSFAATPTHHTVKYAGEEREYFLYVPENLLPEKPIIYVLHGYGGKADGYRPEIYDLAEKEGFAVCMPQGLKAPKGKTGWNVRYPKQEGMKSNDVKFMCFLKRHIQKNYDLGKVNSFFMGMSNGGEMCYIMAYLAPKEFSAYASIAGLTMKWLYTEHRAKIPVPFMEVHGTKDKTSLWEGDSEGVHGWGGYIPVPQAIAELTTCNRCVRMTKTELEKKRNQVIMHSYESDLKAWKTENAPKIEVRLYEVCGGKHTWALNDMDTLGEAWRFFQKYMR